MRPLAISGAALVAGERGGAAAIQRRRRLGARVPPRGCFTTNSNLASILSSAFFFFFFPGSAPRQGPALQCHLCTRPQAGSPESLTHAVTPVVAYEWNPRTVSQPVSLNHFTAMLLGTGWAVCPMCRAPV